MKNPDETLDAVGLRCPLPVLKARKRLADMASGTVLRLCVDDPAAPIDVAHFCAENGHALLEESVTGDGGWAFLIRKGS